MKTIYKHPVLGEITVNRSARSRRVSVSVRPSGVTLTIPPRFPLEEALAFAESKRAWIESAKERAAQRVRPPQVIVPPFRTRLHELVLRTGERPDGVIRGGQLLLTLPPDWTPESEPAQALIRRGIIEVYRREAKTLLPERVAALARQHGFAYSGLSFRNAVSRWGSCSGRNSLSLSIHLMSLPDELIDYVILHELCHTRHKNHGPKFHALLHEVTAGRHAELNRRLKSYSPRW